MKKILKELKKICSIFIILIMVLNLSACKSGKEDQKKLNIFLDTSDIYSSEVIKFMIDDYKKSNPDVEVKLNNVLGEKSDIMDTINKGTEVDMIFTNRNTLIELSKKGVLSDLYDTYEENNISDRYYDIMGSYGRVGDKYYGIGVIPYSVELLYNKANLEKLKIANPTSLKKWLDVLKQINAKGMKTPIVLTDDVDADGFLFSLVASKVINIHEIEESYDSGEESYKKIKGVQDIFKEFNSLAKDKVITKNSFELGNKQSVINFNNGDSPLLVAISYFNSKLNGSNIGIVEDYDNNSKFGSNIPIIINSLLSVPVNAKNMDTANDFIKYIYSDEVQARIVQKEIISGNKVANSKVSGTGKIMVEHMYKANDNSVLLIYNIPEILKNNVLLTLKKILDGVYNSKEWDETLKKSYK
ncbi:ABC transporter substrate-binding protein [Clostridium lacusfryxellense]|uniref:ABC transporter substrate-binding protein n=1 Tax=Clostridium lacusfryxellense TaxID=205328 RepID=UPI001C0D8BD3|nr:ABC transporter substrate-binding protein [Clostridium lacusfryxellense]MBU3110922.1 ABC transporter substrate-binding protein [Clostridium lacusfryxellense]